MIIPSREEFIRLAAEYNVVPVYREILADLETPVSAYLKLAGGEYGALLESIEGGELWGRYSMIGLDPSLLFESRNSEVTITRGKQAEKETVVRPLARLDELVKGHKSAVLSGLPRLAGGAVGFVAYDMVRRIERLPDSTSDDLGLPDTRFAFFETVVLFDHQFHTVKVVVNAQPGADPGAAYDRASQRIEELVARLLTPLAPSVPRASAQEVRFTSTVSASAYAESVKQAKEYIRAGDVVQVVLAHRLEAEFGGDPFEVYRALRVINPSPYLFYLRLGELTIVGSSPEALVRRQGERVETRPIAGTRPRGEGEIEDRLLEGELLASEKEKAEHVMLVDLGRNDLGRVSRFGTVETSEFMKVERYSHVMHLVSNVRGELRPRVSNADVLESCFPAGTVSGAPKIRAMEIIEELEPVRRGLYAGAIGYMDFHGNMDTCIAIRTLLFRGGKAYLGVGAGIVADSDPEAEYRETMGKGSALMKACELAAEGLENFSRGRASRLSEAVPARNEGKATAKPAKGRSRA